MKKILGFGIVAAVVISSAIGSQLMACNEENNFVDCLVNTKINQQGAHTEDDLKKSSSYKITSSKDEIILFDTLSEIKNSFTSNETDMIVGQRLNVTDFKVTSLTWAFEKGFEPAQGNIRALILLNADVGTDSETIASSSDDVLFMQDMSSYLQEHTFNFVDAPFLTGEVVFALSFDYTSEPYCCAISRLQLLDNTADGESTTRSPGGSWENVDSDEGLKIIGIQAIG